MAVYDDSVTVRINLGNRRTVSPEVDPCPVELMVSKKFRAPSIELVIKQGDRVVIVGTQQEFEEFLQEMNEVLH